LSTRRLSSVVEVPPYVKKIFTSSPEPTTPEEKLWRERVARMILDSLGYTTMTMKPPRHNEIVRYARRWFRGMFDDLEDPSMVDNPVATFDAAGIIEFEKIRDALLAVDPFLFPDRNESSDDEE
jgi:hypothetical protein